MQAGEAAVTPRRPVPLHRSAGPAFPVGNASRANHARLIIRLRTRIRKNTPVMDMNTKYDYLIVGSGLFGATVAFRARQKGLRCLVIEKRDHLGGNIHCDSIEGINVHRYGAHIFHTDDREVWEFVNSLVEFNRYTNSPVANYKGKLYNLPFNMNTFYQM